ncbi:MAG: S8 family serine peptidase [Haloarculaceae archaeon]
MTRTNRRAVLKGIVAGAASLTVIGPATGTSGAGRYIVTTTKGGATKRLKKAGFTVQRELAGGDVLLVSGRGSPADVKGVGAAVRDVELRLERPELEEALEEAGETEAESLYPLQWDKQTTNVAEAHDTTTGEETTVAIIDTGTDLDHPDLAPNAVPGALFRRVTGDGPKDGVFTGTGNDVRLPKDPLTVDDEVTNGDGDVVGYHPDAFEVSQMRDASDDVEGHGSHVSGIAAASVGEPVLSEDYTGIAGTAPDATIVPHRVFYWEKAVVTYDTENGETTEELVYTATTTADILAAIDFAANILGVEAMNLSIGTPPLPPQLNRTGFRQAYRLVIQDAVSAGSVVVVSAGNSGKELNKGGVFTVPNSVPGAMSISATGPNDKRVFYSNYGANEISVGAPGGGYETLKKTLSTDTEWPFPTNLVISTTPPDVYGAAYAYFAGTSMAAPQVAGAAALAAAANSNLNPNQIESVIENNAKKATGQQKDDLGAGVLDAAGTVAGAESRRKRKRNAN